jgi:hypothetical protein
MDDSQFKAYYHFVKNKTQVHKNKNEKLLFLNFHSQRRYLLAETKALHFSQQ